ncbi:MAG: PDDEXK nuclease domain-containing protein [Sulfuricaulis sp.]
MKSKVPRSDLLQSSDARNSLPKGYSEWLSALKSRIHDVRLRASLAVNRELVLLYWRIGCEILDRQGQQGWGAKVIGRLAADLRLEFPEIKGFSRSNLLYMRGFAEAWPEEAIVQQLVGLLPWGHNLMLLSKLKSKEERKWYATQAIEHGWSRNILVHQIELKLHERQGSALTNFSRTLPVPQSDLAQQILKDPYQFDFLTLDSKARERDLEHGLLRHLRDFLLELGVGFSFVGSQYHLEVGEQDYYLDLLFYHLKLRCYVVIDLKIGDFIPEFAGKMNFYLSAVDSILRHEQDAPSIGLILCKNKNGLVVEYALRDSAKPIGVSEYIVKFTESLPQDLAEDLPSTKQIETELGDDST